MKAEDYVTKWCDETYKGGKELGDWTTTEVMKFANDFSNEKLRLLAVSGSLAKQEALKELLDYIDSFLGSGHDYWWINSKIRDKVYWMLERSKANDR